MSEASDAVVNRLLEVSVLKTTDDHQVQPSPKFQRERERYLSTDDTASPVQYDEKLRSIDGTSDPKFAATAAAIAKQVPTFEEDSLINASLLIRRIEVSDRVSGVPNGFLLLGKDELQSFLTAHPASIVFCWRGDSSPSMKLTSQLEELWKNNHIPDYFGLAAVYGPTNYSFLQQQYDAVVAPTLLFCRRGRVDCRLIGNHGQSTVMNEIEILADTV
jgi:hypothetical protein